MATTAYRVGADVVVDLTDRHPQHMEVLHFGTVCKTKDDEMGVTLHQVSGIPGKWFPAYRLALADRRTAEWAR